MRNLIALFAALVLPAAAGATSLRVFPDRFTYVPGDTITLTVVGDDDGATGAFYSAFGRLLYSSALTDPGTSAVQTPVGTGWIMGTTPQIDGESTAFDQLNFNGGTGDFLAPGGSVIATLTLLAASPGTINVTWREDLAFFGLSSASAQGTSFCVCDAPIPEPTTAALLALGLLALAAQQRRNRCGF